MAPEKLSQLGEFGLIDLIKRQIGRLDPSIEGIGDDTAVVPSSGRNQVLLTTDMLIEGVHFTKETPADLIGRKAMACSISDIAAMGGIPKYALVSLGVSAQNPIPFVKKIYAGMLKLAREYGVTVVGGDTVKSEKVIINVALTGEVSKKSVVRRGGARRGDQIFVTGPLGGSLRSGWHLRFKPRVVEARFLVEHFKPTAMIDISDGLAADLGHILERSAVGAVLYAAPIPRRGHATLDQALYDGEDFELVFTLPPQAAMKLTQSKESSFSFWPIGEIVDRKQGLQLVDEQGKRIRIEKKGYTHF